MSTVKKIGIPRALSFYNNFPFYYGFFKHLGIDIVVSDKTTSKIINEGSRYTASETCLPVKVFAGHVLNLLDKGVYDIFIPSLQSNAYKINNCSKIRGLPDIIRNIIDRPLNIIDPELNITERRGFYSFWNETAQLIGIEDKKLIKTAIEAGWEKYDNFIKTAKNGLPYNKAFENALNNVFESRILESVKPVSVVIAAHGYNLFDERISLNIIKKLEKMNVKVYTPLNVLREEALESVNKLEELVYWANESELTGTAAYFMLNRKADGVIVLSSFGCGPDSLMAAEISAHAKDMDIPAMHLNIDEHTGEAGFMTRLEAFVDMLVRKKYKTAVHKKACGRNIKAASYKKQSAVLCAANSYE